MTSPQAFRMGPTICGAGPGRQVHPSNAPLTLLPRSAAEFETDPLARLQPRRDRPRRRNSSWHSKLLWRRTPTFRSYSDGDHRFAISASSKTGGELRRCGSLCRQGQERTSSMSLRISALGRQRTPNPSCAWSAMAISSAMQRQLNSRLRYGQRICEPRSFHRQLRSGNSGNRDKRT